MILKKMYIKLTLISFLGILVSSSLLAQPVAPPDVKMVDEFGVNIATRQVMAKVDTVSIGGERGLSHNIQGETNLFSHIGNYGYKDKYDGSANYVPYSTSPPSRLVRNGTEYMHAIYVMRVFGPVGSQDFMVVQNGNQVHNAGSLTGDHEYVALGDTRHTLDVSADKNHLIWTTEDGTELIYSGNYHHKASDGGVLTQIRYPNGLIIDITFTSVSTNTGYILKYINEGHGTLSSTDLSHYNANPSANYPPPNDWDRNPTKIVGLNQAYTYCTKDTSSCNISGWPHAEFDWPDGMPTKLYLNTTGNTGIVGRNIFYVTDSHGGTTELVYQSQNACLRDMDDPDSTFPNCEDSGKLWAPRLVAIKSANSDVPDRTFEYKNEFGPAGLNLSFALWALNSHVGLIKSVSGPMGNAGYSSHVSHPNPGPDYSMHGGTGTVEFDGHVIGKLHKVELNKQGTYHFEWNYRNFVNKFVPISGPIKEYFYDDDSGGRGNLYRIKEGGPNGPGRSLWADYPSNCTNRKKCNKPIWTKDYKGNRTDYTYNSLGQVTSVTGPADEDGIRPQTRNTYTQLYAYYKKDSNTIERADTPISLLTQEAYCRTTAASGNGCAGGALDEVVTEYYYGPQQAGIPNNLHLRGKSVTAEGDNGLETRVTCYEYDKYGNRIGETLPLGNTDKDSASDCP